MFHQIPTTIRNFSLQMPIGHGSSSIVYQAIDNKTQDYVALKFVPREVFKHPIELQHFERELRVLPRLNHKNIAKFKETLFLPDYIVIVMEKLDCEQLPIGVISPQSNQPIFLRWAKELLEALDYLHQHGIAHLDVKPENIGFDYQMQLKLFDFGLCTLSNCAAKTIISTDRCGTPLLAAPEIATQTHYDARKADIWSFGITMYYLATHRYPFVGVNKKNFVQKMPHIDEYIDIQVDGPLGEIIKQALIMDPMERPTAAELLSLPIFDQAEKLRLPIHQTLTKSSKSKSGVNSPIRLLNNRIPIIRSPFSKQTSLKSINYCIV